MLLQEFYFKNALDEQLIKIENNFGIDHKTGTCFNNSIIYPVVFPLKMINEILNISKNKEKELNYFYRGIYTEKKKWILDFKTKENTIVEFSDYGRDPTKKYNLDIDYYTKMSSAYFTLCPIDVYQWSYRFFEAIMARTIPILDDDTEDIYSYRFKFYKKSDEHVYCSDWIDYNIEQLFLFHTINNIRS